MDYSPASKQGSELSEKKVRGLERRKLLEGNAKEGMKNK